MADRKNYAEASTATPRNQAMIELKISDYIPLMRAHSTKIQLNLAHESSGSAGGNNLQIVPVDAQHVDLTTAGIPAAIPDFIFTAGKSGAHATVLNNCWQHKNLVNQFYRNSLSYFVYCYLDYSSSETPMNQIKALLVSLSTNPAQVVHDLITNLKNTHAMLQLTQQDHPQAHAVVSNAANGKFLGGVSTYGKGSAEEALCRDSDLFLRMLLEHAWGAYQINILKKLLEIFLEMLTTNTDPISDKASSDKLASTMVNLITKAGFDGYCIFYNANHMHYRVHCSENVLLKMSGTAITLDKLAVLSPEHRQSFLNTCHTNIHVLSVASKDNRLIGSNPMDFFSKKDSNYDVLLNDIKTLTITMSEKYTMPVTLILLPLGCGAFGNKTEDFADAVLKTMAKTPIDPSKIKSTVLATFFDNYAQLHAVFSHSMGNNYNNSGVLLQEHNGIVLQAKMQDIAHYQHTNVPAGQLATIVSISADRHEIPGHYSYSPGKSALGAIFYKIASATPATEFEQIKGIFSAKTHKNGPFCLHAARDVFGRNMYFVSLENSKMHNDGGLSYLMTRYQESLAATDDALICSVDFTLFGVGANNYSMETSCQALMCVLQKSNLKNIKNINIISNDATQLVSISKYFEQKRMSNPHANDSSTRVDAPTDTSQTMVMISTTMSQPQ